jgi:hypothetical protein
VKVGDTLYSKKAVEEYGWIYAPTEKTTWDEVVDDADLLSTGVEWLTNGGITLDSIEAKAVDLHFTDNQIESLRIYKKVNVRSVPHDVTHSFPLSKLEIELLNPQNTKITVGKTIKTLTEKNVLQQEEAKKQYSKLSKTDEQILLEVHGVDGKITELLVTIDGVTVKDKYGTTLIKGSSIETDTLYVNAANVDGTLFANDIAGGRFLDSDQSNWIEMGEVQLSNGKTTVGYFHHYCDGYSSTEPVFVMGYFNPTGLAHNWVLAPFNDIVLDYVAGTMYAVGDWDFSQANVTGITPVWG